MEILYASLLGIFIILVIYLFYNHKSSGNANLPPWKNWISDPVIGETLEFLYVGWKGHSDKFISDRIAKYFSNVFKTSLFGSPLENKDMVLDFPLAEHYTFLLACCSLKSVEDPNIVPMLKNALRFVLMGAFSVPIDLLGTPLNCAMKASFIQKELLVIIKQRKIEMAKGMASSTQDILSHMLSTSDDNGYWHIASIMKFPLSSLVESICDKIS
ncbi:hypothetical protein RHMOL_Rhmol10G0059000 [Rhododendron molle]|uniref:Uncharacterized protein n=1 Tax=Rhododendron molle TaxID=49168 RepID=A0ACC0M0W8_RHOML|nr:hypothetical protein RHMOL_Rhmol10G0059000 [Rhododendron molle]